MDFKNSIDVMQAIVTELTEGALVHRLQGQIFKSQGLEKLGQKYIDHFTEEMEWVEKCANRMLDLGHMPQAQDMKGRTLIEDAEAYLREDLRIQRDGVEKLYMTLPILAGDPTTYDIIKGYLQDEEEDLYWSEGQIELIEKIGIQNWLIRQL